MTGANCPEKADFSAGVFSNSGHNPRVATLSSGEVHVWYQLTEALDDRGLSAAVSVLSAAEQIRYNRFLRADDRRDYAAAHALLRHSLSRYADLDPGAWEFDKGANGKPSLAHHHGDLPPLSFNLSHARGIVACAIAPGLNVGIDVEHVDRAVDWSGIATRYFARAEAAHLESCPQEQRASRFIELWTLKEAYMKATGAGLSEALSNFGFDLEHGPAIRFMPPPNVDGAAWQFALFAPVAPCRIGVAIASGDEQAWRIVARSSVTGRPLKSACQG
jgi:4'-phosphopantetheinyl transferase